KPVRQLSPGLGIRDWSLEDPHRPLWAHPPTHRWLTWTNFFLGLDRFIKWVDYGTEPTFWTRGERRGVSPPVGARRADAAPPAEGRALRAPYPWTPWLRRLRQAAVRRAENWVVERFADSDGLGAIFPPMIYTVISLRCLGYRDDAPEVRYALKQLEDLMIEENGTVRLQPCVCPVWDTALTLIALADAGVPGDDPAVEKGVEWLLAKEVRRPGDWTVMNPG